MLMSAKNTIVVHPSLNMYQDRQKNVCFITFSPFNLFPKNVFSQKEKLRVIRFQENLSGNSPSENSNVYLDCTSPRCPSD